MRRVRTFRTERKGVMAISDAKLSKMTVRIMDGQRWSAAWKRAAKENHKRVLGFMRATDGVVDDIEYWKARVREVKQERDTSWERSSELQSQVNHLESDRDALARQVEEMRAVLERIANYKELDMYFTEIMQEARKALGKEE